MIYTSLIGRTDEGSRIAVTLRLDRRFGSTSEQQTTEHHPAPNTYATISLTGEATAYRCREPYAAGQIRDELDTITQPAGRWTLADIKTLADLWERWHLNDLTAGCAHQSVVWENVGYRRPDLTNTPACPLTGYRYGSAWLLDVIPDTALAALLALPWTTQQ